MATVISPHTAQKVDAGNPHLAAGRLVDAVTSPMVLRFRERA